MCHPARCYSCGKTTWSGCGSHVQQVMAQVPKEERCRCQNPEKGFTAMVRHTFHR